MKLTLIILLFCLPGLLLAQPVDLIVQSGHTGSVELLSYSTDGKLLASYGSDKKIIVWNVLLGKQMCSLLYENEVKSMYFTDNNRRLIIGNQGLVKVWDIGTLKTKDSTIVLQKTRIRNQCYVENNFVVTAEGNKLVNRENGTKKTKYKRSCEYFTDVFNATGVSEKNNLLLGANSDGKIYLYSADNGKKVRSNSGKKLSYLNRHNSDVNDLVFNPDETNFASASSDRSIIIWNTHKLFEEKRLAAKSFRNRSINFDASGRYLILGNELGDIKTIDLYSADLQSTTTRVHKHGIVSVSSLSDTLSYFSAGEDNRIIRTSSEQYLKITETNAAYRKFRNFLYEKVLGLFPLLPPNPICCTGCNLQGSLVAAGYENGIITVNHVSNHWKKTLIHHAHQVTDVLFISDSVFISFDGTDSICYWLIHNNKRIYQSSISMPFKANKAVMCNDSVGVIVNSGMIYLYDFGKNVLLSSYPIEATQVKFNKKSNQLAIASFQNMLVLFEISDNKIVRKAFCKGHTATINSIAFHPHRNIVASTGDDASVKLWNTTTGELIVSIIPIGKNDKIAITDDNYYLTSKNNMNAIGFKLGYDLYSADQFDIQFNRPDIVLEKLGFVNEKTIQLYRKAYEKRLQKIGFTETMFSPDWHTPEIEITNLSECPLSTPDDSIVLKIKAWDTRYTIDRIHIWANDVPVYGRNGLSYRSNQAGTIELTVPVSLVPGKNSIQVSCINSNAAESRKENLLIDCIPVKTEKPNLYFIVVSVSDYHDPAINLKYAVKDGRDIVHMFEKNKSIIKNFGHIEIDTLFDSAATRDNFFKLKSKILGTKPNDRVIVFFSGHGLLNEDQNFYYATSDIDFEKPELKGIAFDEIENFLDSIPARHKLLLVDACHSGEVDKEAVSDDIQIAGVITDSAGNQLAQNNSIKEYTYRSIEYNPSKSGAGIYNSFDIMKEMFAGLDKGTGTMVLAAAAGTGLAIESNEWKNGIFTYTIINGVKNKQADLNHDGQITVSEIKDYSIKEVETITGGRQKPTARKENSAYDWKLR